MLLLCYGYTPLIPIIFNRWRYCDMTIGKEIHLHLVSDSTGETTYQMARAALAQFPSAQVIEHVWTLVRTPDHIPAIANSIKEHEGVVFYSISDTKIRKLLEEVCHATHVPCLSILDHAVHILSKRLGQPSTGEIGAQHRMDEAYFHRMEALDFAVHHDDGQGLNNLTEADILLVGVSRTSKTPTSIYLANRGYKVANYPLVPGVAPPLASIKASGVLVVGLIKDARQLAHIRRNRLRAMQQQEKMDYDDIQAIKAELANARQLYQQNNWAVIDVTRKSVEETAAEIINIYRQTETGTGKM